MVKNNVIQLRDHLENKNKKKAKREPIFQEDAAPIVDMTERREAILSEERRQVRRTILTGFIGSFVVLPKSANSKGGLLKVDIYDISENGIAFDMNTESGHFKKGDDLAMRVYLNQHTYFSFVINIQNFRHIEGDAAYRHGANFVKGTLNDEALFHFVKFIETISASLERDTGDVLVSNLKK